MIEILLPSLVGVVTRQPEALVVCEDFPLQCNLATPPSNLLPHLQGYYSTECTQDNFFTTKFIKVDIKEKKRVTFKVGCLVMA